jgi:hypothetical protein
VGEEEVFDLLQVSWRGLVRGELNEVGASSTAITRSRRTSLPNVHFAPFLLPSVSQISTLICLAVSASRKNPLASAMLSVTLGRPRPSPAREEVFFDDDPEPRNLRTLLVLYTVLAMRIASCPCAEKYS